MLRQLRLTIGRLMRDQEGRAARRYRGRAGDTGSLRRVATLAFILTTTMLAVTVTNASALIVQVQGRRVGYQPLPSTSSAQAKPASGKLLEYHGGPVAPSNTNYALYWDPAGAAEYPTGYQGGIDRYFEDLAHDSGGTQNTDSVLSQYGDKSGAFASYNSHFGGALLDSDPYPANGCSAAAICFTDEQLRAEIRRYVEAQKLPSDVQHQYYLLTPPGVESCLEASGHSCSAGTKHSTYCSYHSYIAAGGVIVYANIPYMNATNCDPGEEHPNGNPSDAALGGGLAHEHSEAVTDPELNAWYASKNEEVGDKCRTFKAATEFGAPLGKAPDGSNYNQIINADLYWYQQEWSNEAAGCEQRAGHAATAPTVTALAPKIGPASGGTSVAVTGTGFAGSLSVKFGASTSTAVTVNSTTSLTAVSPPSSVGTVDVTVTTASGTSAPNKGDHFKYKKG
jgi:IPT/TIG domain-containing protein